jgi:hypothetical protein
MKLAIAVLALVAVAAGVELDGSNFESSISGKGAFIKFQAPW